MSLKMGSTVYLRVVANSELNLTSMYEKELDINLDLGQEVETLLMEQNDGRSITYIELECCDFLSTSIDI